MSVEVEGDWGEDGRWGAPFPSLCLPLCLSRLLVLATQANHLVVNCSLSDV